MERATNYLLSIQSDAQHFAEAVLLDVYFPFPMLSKLHSLLIETKQEKLSNLILTKIIITNQY